MQDSSSLGRLTAHLLETYQFCFVETVPYAFFRPKEGRDIAVNLRGKDYHCRICGRTDSVEYQNAGRIYFSKGKLAEIRRTSDELGRKFPFMGEIEAGMPFRHQAVGICAACAREHILSSHDPAQRAVNLCWRQYHADALLVIKARQAMERSISKWVQVQGKSALSAYSLKNFEEKKNLACAIILDDTAELSSILAEYEAVTKHNREALETLLPALPEQFEAYVARPLRAFESMNDKLYHEYTVAFPGADTPDEEFFLQRRIDRDRMTTFLHQERVGNLSALLMEAGFRPEWTQYFCPPEAKQQEGDA